MKPTKTPLLLNQDHFRILITHINQSIVSKVKSLALRKILTKIIFSLTKFSLQAEKCLSEFFMVKKASLGGSTSRPQLIQHVKSVCRK